MRNHYKKSITKSKQMYYQNIINNTYSNSKQLYRLIDQLLGRINMKMYPDNPHKILCNKFLNVFNNKLNDTSNLINAELIKLSHNNIILPHVPAFSNFCNFILPTQIQIYNILVKIKICSQNDSIPISTFKNILNTTYKYIHKIIFNTI